MKSLILGVDPGTTVGFAVLDLDGRLLYVDSKKEYSISSLIRDVLPFGHVVAVGTDKSKAPSFVRDISVKLGARLFLPSSDLLIDDKKKLIESYIESFGDAFVVGAHQRDAFSSALFAFKVTQPLIKKVDSSLNEVHKSHLRDEVANLVVRDRIAVKIALSLVDQPEVTSENVKVKLAENYIPGTIQDRLARYRKENRALRTELEKKRSEVERLTLILNRFQEMNKKLVTDVKAKKILFHKENRLSVLHNKVSSLESDIHFLSKELDLMRSFIPAIQSCLLIKKLQTLSYKEFIRKERILKIRGGDILMVEDSSIFSEKTISFLKPRVRFILSNNSNRLLESHFIFINPISLSLRQVQDFALVKPGDFEAALKNQRPSLMFESIVDEYKKTRTVE